MADPGAPGEPGAPGRGHRLDVDVLQAVDAEVPAQAGRGVARDQPAVADRAISSQSSSASSR